MSNLTREDGKAFLGATGMARRKGPLKILWGKINKLRLRLVVPTGLFPVKTGIYMPNKIKDLDRRPLSWLT